ncbi:MAG: GH3 auxin-responsive promoter family protein [Deltaproteobacteria bacterium]|nr:MAG: GH3 auxin-responsive promoter family protein [Deltaproteobacteria bacterium]
MGIIVKAAAFVAGRQWTRWEELTNRPQDTQDRLLLHIITRNRSTRFGGDHRFDAIHTLRDYRKQVDIGDYERLRPYMERAKNGEANTLTEEPIVMFTMTSGSTGEPKLIPVTETSRRNHRQLTRFWYYRALVDHPDLFSGKLLGVVSPAIEGRTAGGIPFGSASGLVYQSSPSWIQNANAAPREIAEVKDFEAKYYLTMRLALEHDITFLGTPNPSTILKLVESVNQNKYEIIKDICDGKITARCNLQPEMRAALAGRLRKNPARAKRLESLIKNDGTLRPKEYWPRLQLMGCWKGGTVGVRLKEFARWFAKATPLRDLGYMASEAQMTLPISDEGSAGILAINENFYEFIPESEIGSPAPTTLTCAEIEKGASYYLVLTTPAGLYRYDINDIVRVAGFYNQTPLIEFVCKGRDVTNITGEKLHVNHVIQAMAQAQNAARMAVQHFRACADVEKSRYSFFVELDGVMPTQERLVQLLHELDASLRVLNVEYAQKRESRRLDAPVLCVMKSGWFQRKANAVLQPGTRDVQFKAQLLSSIPEEGSEIQFVVQCANELLP